MLWILLHRLFNHLLLSGFVRASRGTNHPASQSDCLNGAVGGVAQEKRVVGRQDGNRPAHEEHAIDAEDRSHDGINVGEWAGREVHDTSDRDQPVCGGTGVADHAHNVLRDHFALEGTVEEKPRLEKKREYNTSWRVKRNEKKAILTLSLTRKYDLGLNERNTEETKGETDKKRELSWEL